VTAPDYPQPIVPVDHVEPVPRRVRALLAGRTVLDTTTARYVWEGPAYPQFYIPIGDVNPDLLVDEDHVSTLKRGTARRLGLLAGETERPAAARHYLDGPLEGYVRFEWSALDAWFEEDEEVFVHPRNPYARVDVLRSSRSVRVELDGVVLAASFAPLMLFETGLPTRYYIDKTDVRWEHLVPSDTQTACPYKGRTTGYWSVRIGDHEHADLAWCYDFPTREVLPIAGLVAFYNEKVDVFLDGELLPRPKTPFS
jgi:uncharacterized protein (DUF427 family)